MWELDIAPAPGQPDKNCISPEFKSEFNELIWAAGTEDSRWNEDGTISCAITHANWDEKVTSPSVSGGTHTCFVPLAAQDF